MVVLGRITGAFGIRGWVRIHAFGDDPQSWAAMPTWWLSADDSAPDSQWLSYGLMEFKPHGDAWVARLKDVADRTAAEALRGLYLGVPRDALPESGEDEYYWADLIGLDVVNLAGEKLGQVAEVLDGVAHDVLRVVDESGVERLLPFVEAVVQEVATDRIIVEWGADWGLD